MQGFRRIFYTPDEAAHIIAHCKERLIKAKIITGPFSGTEIQGGVLKEYLIDEDYLVPQKVNFTNHCHSLLIRSWGLQQPKLSATYYFFYTFSKKNDWRPGIWHFKKPLNNRHIQRLRRKKVKPTPICNSGFLEM